MIAALGVNEEEEHKGGLILPVTWKRKVVKVFYNLITLREQLWKKRHSEAELEPLQGRGYKRECPHFFSKQLFYIAYVDSRLHVLLSGQCNI